MDSTMPGESVSPTKGNVAFGSAAQGWGFTVGQMAQIYSRKFGVDVEKMATRLWGEHYSMFVLTPSQNGFSSKYW